MSTAAESPFKSRLVEKLVDSLTSPLPRITARHVHGRVSLPGKAAAVIGMRRAGKTTFLHQQRLERFESGVTRECLPYINFEDEQLESLVAKDLHLVIEEHYRRFPALRGHDTVTWCFDEIQLVPGWERFIRRLLDSEKVEVFISGSSAALLSREIATSLRGRAWEVLIHPFSFEEVLRHHGKPVPERPDFLSSRERSALERAFLDYLGRGGFPEVQGEDVESRRALLRSYVDVAMLRDVVERHQVGNVTGLRWLVRHLLGNAAGLFSVEKFYAALKSQGFSIAKETVHHLLAYLEDCFLVRTVWLEADSERRRMANPRKAYPVDPGLIPIYDRTGRANLGHALETAVLLELERRRCEITYVRTPEGHEVDFLARHPGGELELIQVTASLTDETTAERELRALDAAKPIFPKAKRRLLTLNRETPAAAVPKGLIVQPAYEWMLAGDGG